MNNKQTNSIEPQAAGNPTVGARPAAPPPSGPAPGSPSMELLLMPETYCRKIEELFPVARMTDEQVRTMNHALGHPKDADYRPYCMAMGCRVMPRMFRVVQGFKCWSCLNVIGFDLRRIEKQELSQEHAFTCKKCGCHVTKWHNDIFYCQACGEPHKKKENTQVEPRHHE